MQADTETTTAQPAVELISSSRQWLQRLKAMRLQVVLFALFGILALKAMNPMFGLGSKRSKSYRFRGNALGFFVGDTALFSTSTAEEAERRMVEVFPEKLQPKVNRIIRPVLTLCEKHQVDPFWILSVMWTESHFKFQVTSKKGARGLMQVMPITYAALIEEMHKVGIPMESDRGEEYLASMYPEAYQDVGYKILVSKLRNLEVGIYYLKTLLGSFNHNHFHATVAYNMGPTWTRERLRTNQPVAIKNHYLNKVMKAYFHITKNLSHNANVSFVTQIN